MFPSRSTCTPCSIALAMNRCLGLWLTRSRRMNHLRTVAMSVATGTNWCVCVSRIRYCSQLTGQALLVHGLETDPDRAQQDSLRDVPHLWPVLSQNGGMGVGRA